MTPKDAQKISNADLFFWIGPGLESFLKKPIKTLASKARVIELLKTPGLDLINLHPHDEDHHHHHCECDHGHDDPHIWLDPKNALVIVDAIKDALSQQDPHHKNIYHQNAQELKIRIQKMDQALQKTLSPVKISPYLVFHDGYKYLERAYSLNSKGPITVSPEIPLTIKRLHSLRNMIKDQKVQCIFAEVQFPPAPLKNLQKGLNVNFGTLDPYGQSSYEDMMNTLAKDIHQCLSKK
jgi:zinc transport system substrate-binding protein